MNRRTFLAATGVTLTGVSVGLAGCEAAPGAGEVTEATETTAEGGTATPTAATGTAQTGTAQTGTAQTGTSGTPGTGTDAGTTTVEMVTEDSTFFFDPIGLLVEPGATVTWRIASGSHTSTAYAESLDAANTTRIPSDAEPWNSDILSEEGATFEHAFEVPGTYDYFCVPHKALGMVGRVVVGEPGGPATESEIPDGSVPSSETIVEQGVVGHEEFTG